MKRFSVAALAVVLIIVLVAAEIYIIKKASDFEPGVEVCYASMFIPKDTVITAEMLKTREIKAAYSHRLAVSRAEKAIGKTAAMDIEEGEMLLSSKLTDEISEKIVAKDKSKRLFAIGFSGDQANGWQVSADQYADILFVADDKGKNEGDISEQEMADRVTVVKNVRIAAVTGDNGKLIKEGESSSIPRYIVFEVTEEEAKFLAAAKGEGRLELAVLPGR